MIERYENAEVAQIWTDRHKLELWQETELAAILAREQAGKVPDGIHRTIAQILRTTPIDVEWWKRRDAEIHHDLNAFLDERLRHLPQEQHKFFHAGLTSYDTEEPAFQRMIIQSLVIIKRLLIILLEDLHGLSGEHQKTPMLGRTHGQEAKMQSFGKRVLTWIAQINVAVQGLLDAEKELFRSKLSGAVGNYQGLNDSCEAAALNMLGFQPFLGATQIMPRVIHAAVADAVCRVVYAIGQVAEDIRLGSRSGLPIVQEPFGKKQKGSSAMPHKKNTIRTEQVSGMVRLAEAAASAIRANIITWEERAIEQSCVERVAWPDLFHVTAKVITVMTSVVSGLAVYETAMAQEIKNSLGTFASEDVKDFLKEKGADIGFTHEDAYRIVQLASFNAFSRKHSIETIIPDGCLSVCDELDCTEELVEEWNYKLRELFRGGGIREYFAIFFTPGYQLRGENVLFENVVPIDIMAE